MGLKHFFHSSKADPADPTIIGATKWNADHYYVDAAGAPIGNVGALLLAGAAGALTHLNSVAAGQVLTSAGVGALPVWAAPSGGSVPAALVADSLTLSLANPEIVLSRSAANKLLIGGASFALLQFGGTTNAFPAVRPVSNQIWIRYADDSDFAPLAAGNVYTYGGSLFYASGAQFIRFGTGTPEGAVTASVGSLFLRIDGGAGTTLYVKQTGAATATGWVGK